MQVGELIQERFEVQAHIVTGGMGAVFRAYDRLLGVPAAIKLLRFGAGNDASRFSREAHVLSELRHPGIVKYLAHGTTALGELFLAMEWLEGEDLSSRLAAREQLRVSEVVELGLRVAEALSAAHRQGVVHRDIKPSNIWLVGSALDQIKILDFGVALLTGASQTVTHTGVAVGTPGYMAPEQARGEQVLDSRVDLFSLGCVLYECLTGTPAFTGDHVVAVLAKVLLQEAPHVREHRRDVPRALDDLVARLLCKEPSGRPQDADEVCDALRQMQNESLLPSGMSSLPPALTRSEQRFVSVIVASTSSSYSYLGLLHDLDRARLQLDAARLSHLREALSAYDARLEVLADGSLVAMIAGHLLASELVVRSARCALTMREIVPEASLAICTGRGLMSGAQPVGEVIDRAFADLAVGRAGAIRLDEVTVKLLDSRLEVAWREGIAWLQGERESAAGRRTLLGRPVECVGRDRELSILKAIYNDSVAESSASVVMITAEAGIGKSRVRQEFLSQLRTHDAAVTVIMARGDSLSAGSPLGMLSSAMRHFFGMIENEPVEVKRYKLRARVSRVASDDDLPRVLEFFGELTGVPFNDDPSLQLKAARGHPTLMSDQMRSAWEAWLSAELEQHPVVIVLEDLHWGDGPTVQFVGSALRRLANRPLMVLALAHPDVHQRFAHLWSDCQVTELSMRGLSEKACKKIIQSVLGDSIDSSSVERIIARSGGNAFYLEELIRASARGQRESLPETVFGMVQSRLDDMDSEARRVLRAASIFGRVFTEAGVIALLGGDSVQNSVKKWLNELTVMELLVRRYVGVGDKQEIEYAFRHEVLREAAYAMLTDEDRMLGHRLAGRWLSDHSGRDPLVMAEHFERGQMVEIATEYYARAAKEALGASDLDEAVTCADRAMACGAHGERLGALLLIQAEAYRWKDELKHAERCAEEALTHLSADSESWFSALGELVAIAGLTGAKDRLDAHVKRLLYQVQVAPDRNSQQLNALARAAWQKVLVGEYAAAEHLLEYIERLGSDAVMHDPVVNARVLRVRAYCQWVGGNIATALSQLATVRERFEHAGDLRNLCLAQLDLTNIYLELGEGLKAEQSVTDALRIAERMRIDFLVALSKATYGAVLSRQGKFEQARRVLEVASTWFMHRKAHRLEGICRNLLAEAWLGLRLFDDALREAKVAVELLSPFTPRLALARATLAQVRLAREEVGFAHLEARAALDLLELLGRLPDGESKVRLVYVESAAANSDRQAASEILGLAYRLILDRAQRMTDAQMRQRYLRDVPANYRTLLLASQWGLLPHHELAPSLAPGYALN